MYGCGMQDVCSRGSIVAAQAEELGRDLLEVGVGVCGHLARLLLYRRAVSGGVWWLWEVVIQVKRKLIRKNLCRS